MSDDEMPDDPLPRIRAEMDQMVELAPELARLAYGWFEAFSDAGFADSQALYLAAAQMLQDPGTAP